MLLTAEINPLQEIRVLAAVAERCVLQMMYLYMKTIRATLLPDAVLIQVSKVLAVPEVAVEAVEGTILPPGALAMLGLPLHPVLIMPFL
jgi:hypothetical protein